MKICIIVYTDCSVVTVSEGLAKDDYNKMVEAVTGTGLLANVIHTTLEDLTGIKTINKCPKCGAEMTKWHRAGTFALPESTCWVCTDPECGWSSDPE